MSDETFIKHYNARHLADARLDAPLPEWTANRSALIRAWRAFHRRCHEITMPGQHDHEHLADWE